MKSNFGWNSTCIDENRWNVWGNGDNDSGLGALWWWKKTSAPYFILPLGFFIHSHTGMQSQSFLIVECLFHNGTAKNSLKFCLEWKKKKNDASQPISTACHKMTGGCVCMRVHCVCVSEWRLHWRGGLVSDRKANWQAQTHRSGESMGPARAYLLPMMKPNTMNTSMMVPATATTAMMMTGFCSLETIAADEMDTHTKEKRKHFEWTSAHQTTICRTFGNWAHWEAWRLITCPTPHPFPNLWESGRGTFLFLSCPYTHGSTVSESGLNSPRRRQRCPSSQTKTHSGWIVSHAQLSLCSDSLHWQTGECNRKKSI